MIKNILIVFMLLGLSSATLDLRRSIERIQEQINVTKYAPADWTQLPLIIEQALPCLSLIGLFEVKSNRLPDNLKQYIENIVPAQFAQQLLKVDWAEVNAKGSEIKPNVIWEELAEFMKTESFKTIHNHIWEDGEFLDLIGFLYGANYPEIYAAIKEFYKAMGQEELTANIPSEPPSYPAAQKSSRKVARSNVPKASSQSFPMISMKSSILQQKAECDIPSILGLLKLINDSNIHEVIKVIFYLVQEVLGNAALHVLCLKIGETQKGAFFHETLALPEMEEFLPLVQGVLLAEPGFAQLNEILGQVTGLNLGNTDLFKYIVDLIQYLVWNYPFPE